MKDVNAMVLLSGLKDWGPLLQKAIRKVLVNILFATCLFLLTPTCGAVSAGMGIKNWGRHP